MCAKCVHAPALIQAEYFCAQCRTPFLNPRPLDESGLCRLCAAGLHNFDGVYAFGDYSGELRDLIHLFKYQRMRPLAPALGRMLASSLPRDLVVDAIVPMPLHWRKLLSRGFNQSRLLAEEVSKRTGLIVSPLLSRTRHTAPQAGLTSRQRRLNVRGGFRVGTPALVKGTRLLLVDDVFTTGATVNAASETLKRAGAARVQVLALARADRLAGFRGGTAE